MRRPCWMSIMRIAAWLLLSTALVLAALAGRSTRLSAPLYDEPMPPWALERVRIAATDEALTFARFVENDFPQVLLVTGFQNEQVTGVNLTRMFRPDRLDPVALYSSFGYEALRRTAAASPMVQVPVRRLILPFEAHAHHIGIGANYPAHAREVEIEQKPFLFPKIVRPSPFNSPIRLDDAKRLDYEVEVCFVTLREIRQPKTSRLPFGLVLCNDYTDRWALVRNYRRDAELGTTGFIEAKSREGFGAVGNLLVIPRDLEPFYRQLQLELYVNGHLRQRARAANMIWGPRALVDEIFRRADWRFASPAGPVALLSPRQALLPGTLIFSGTPAGVVFRRHNVWNPWIYLRPGDEVVARSDYLGTLHNRIIP